MAPVSKPINSWKWQKKTLIGINLNNVIQMSKYMSEWVKVRKYAPFNTISEHYLVGLQTKMTHSQPGPMQMHFDSEPVTAKKD